MDKNSDTDENSNRFNIEALSDKELLCYVLADSENAAAAIGDLVRDVRALAFLIEVTDWTCARHDAASHVLAIMRRGEAIEAMVRDEHQVFVAAQHAIAVVTQERDALKARIEKLEEELEAREEESAGLKYELAKNDTKKAKTNGKAVHS